MEIVDGLHLDQEMKQTSAPRSDIAIFARLLESGKRRLTPSLARYVLSLCFDESDQARMADLAVRNQEGKISPAEMEELMGYVKAGHLLALLQSKARRSLKSKQAS